MKFLILYYIIFLMFYDNVLMPNELFISEVLYVRNVQPALCHIVTSRCLEVFWETVCHSISWKCFVAVILLFYVYWDIFCSANFLIIVLRNLYFLTFYLYEQCWFTLCLVNISALSFFPV